MFRQEESIAASVLSHLGRRLTSGFPCRQRLPICQSLAAELCLLTMWRVLLNWLISAVALIVVSYVVPGFYLRGFLAALWAAVVIGFVNATLGAFLKFVTLPLSILTLGIFWLVINAIMLELASFFSPSFRIAGFGAAFIGAIVLAIVQMLLRWLLLPKREY